MNNLTKEELQHEILALAPLIAKLSAHFAAKMAKEKHDTAKVCLAMHKLSANIAKVTREDMFFTNFHNTSREELSIKLSRLNNLTIKLFIQVADYIEEIR